MAWLGQITSCCPGRDSLGEGEIWETQVGGHNPQLMLYIELQHPLGRDNIITNIIVHQVLRESGCAWPGMAVLPGTSGASMCQLYECGN